VPSDRGDPAARLAEEAPRLRPLKVRPEELACASRLRGPTGTVMHDGMPDSMPPRGHQHAGDSVPYGRGASWPADRKRCIPASSLRTRVDAGGAPRGSGGRGIGPAWPALSEKGKQLLDLGEPALRYLTEIVHRRRAVAGRSGSLARGPAAHGPEVLRRAMAVGTQEEIFSAAYVRASCQHSLLFQGLCREGIRPRHFHSDDPLLPASVRGEHRPDSGARGWGTRSRREAFFPGGEVVKGNTDNSGPQSRSLSEAEREALLKRLHLAHMRRIYQEVGCRPRRKAGPTRTSSLSCWRRRWREESKRVCNV